MASELATAAQAIAANETLTPASPASPASPAPASASVAEPLALPLDASSGAPSFPLGSSPVALFAVLALFALGGRHRLPELTIRIPSPIYQYIPVPPG
jgi:hypothetical protein